MKYDYDLICIGLGPAGMAVSIMGSEMGLRVCAVEKERVGGECMNIGCIPSKSLLRIAKYRHSPLKLREMGLLGEFELPQLDSPFPRIAEYLGYISSKKTMKMFEKVDLVLGEGPASFVDPHTIEVNGKKYTAQRIFIATGTEPQVPAVEGIEEIDFLTNKNVFSQDKVPGSMVIVGGGAIGCEMAQAFSRLGCRCTIVHMDDYLLPHGNREAGALLEKVFESEGIEVYNSRTLVSVTREAGKVCIYTSDGLRLSGDRLLLAAGRKADLGELDLDKAGVKYEGSRILVDSSYRTSARHIYAVGDCNSQVLLSHAAMHQGMIALMNAVSPLGLFRFRDYVIPWTVFTEPQVSYVGLREGELKRKGIRYRKITVKYEDYGAAIAENVGTGYLTVYVNSFGRVYGAGIVGEGSGEMINEWALVIQKKISLLSILFLAHSFPTMGFLSKRVAETWMMEKMQSPLIRKICGFLYRRT